MRTHQQFSIFLSTLALVALAGCSGKITGTADGLSASPDDKFGDGVSGPALDGTWVSNCTQDWQQNQYETITMQISGRSISRAQTAYTDSACTQQTTGGLTETGLFRYIAVNAEGAYQLEYRFNMPNGWYTEYENIALTDSQLYISNEVGGDGAANLLMNRIGPAPVPGPVQPTPPGQVIDAGTFVASVGDTATYAGEASGTQQTEVYSNTEYNADNNDWFINVLITQDGTPIENDSSEVISWSSAQTKSTFAACVDNGGVLETITVPAGTFNTCRETDDTQTLWYGDVPVLGLVKAQNLDGSYTTELQSFHWGQAKSSKPEAKKAMIRQHGFYVSALSIFKARH